MDVDAFSKSIAAVYGVKLSDKARAGLAGVFSDKATVGDASKYMPAIMKVLEGALGKQDAKSKKSIAGEARRYRDASMSGVDAPALFNALIPAIAGNPALANLIFGSKQGARIRAAIGDPATFLHKLDQLEHHADGYSGDIAKQRMAGFDGAMYRLSGAMANLQTAFGRAFDNGGKGDGGLLTQGTKVIAGGMQAFVDAPAALQRLAFEAAAAATAFVGFKSLKGLTGGFGLGTSATALDHSAGLLDKAALSIIEANGGKAVTAGEKALAESGGKPIAGLKGRAGMLAANTAIQAVTVAPDIKTENGKNILKPIYGPEVDGFNDWYDKNVPSWRQIGKKFRQAVGWVGSSIISPAEGAEAPHGSPFGGLNGARASFKSLPSAGSLGTLGGGPITAIVQQPVPVDVSGKVQLVGQATVSVSVKCDGGSVTNQTASSSGNIKVSTGASMPGAAKAASGQAATK